MKRTLLLVSLFALFVVSPVLAGKPLPPPQLSKIFSEVVEIEDAIGEKQWQKSLQTVAEIDEYLQEMAASVRSVAGDSFYQQLTGTVSGLRSSLEREDFDEVSDALLAMQKQVFLTMNYYHFVVHPSFSVVQEYVAEAIEAAEEADLERVYHEMKEIANVVAGSAEVMAERGIGKGMRQDFLDQLFIVMGASKAQKTDVVMIALKKMERLSGAFVWMAQQQ